MTRTGLEVFLDNPRRWVPRGAAAGLLLNSGSTTADFRLAHRAAASVLGSDLRALFSPQHGLWADVQDNMVESPHGADRHLGIPLWSLYAEARVPAPHMLDGLDVLLVDLQDVGTRVYTFIWTLRLVMEACGRQGVRVVVLDRPNPLGGEKVEGNLLRPEWRSFVGLEAIPMRHGLTMGELALWFRDACGVDCSVEVVRLEGWRRRMLWPETERPWVMPSPNMPSYATALVYPGTVLLEGTSASEGRGTTRPFELVGGPWVDEEELASALPEDDLPGAVFRPVRFLPTFQKWAGRSCGGVQVHVTDPARFLPYRSGLGLLSALWRQCRAQGFGWKEPPYEYETEKLPIHLLLGDEEVRRGVEAGASGAELETLWAEELSRWDEARRACFLYA